MRALSLRVEQKRTPSGLLATRVHRSSASGLPIGLEVALLVLATKITQALGCHGCQWTPSQLCHEIPGSKLTNSNELEVVVLGPVDQPRGELVHCGVVRLVHEGDVAVPAGTGGHEGGFAPVGGSSVPILRINIVGDDLVAHGLEDRERLARRVKVRRPNVRRLLADEVDERILDLGDLGADPVLGQAAQCGVGPTLCECVFCDNKVPNGDAHHVCEAIWWPEANVFLTAAAWS